MKQNILKVLTIFLLAISCNKESDNETVPEDLIGNWKLSHIWNHDGANGNVIPVSEENSFVISFTKNLTYLFPNLPPSCQEGSYVSGVDFENNSLLILSPFGSECVLSEIRFNYSIIDNNKLSLSSTDTNCDEGCFSIFDKIDNVN